MSEEFDINFEEVTEHESDTESIISDIEEEYPLDDWREGSNKFNEFEILYYNLVSNILPDTYSKISFIESIATAYKNSRNITSLRLLADIYNPDDSNDTRYSQNIRFEVENFANTKELKEVLLNCLNNETAPIWNRLETDETSDRTTNKIVKYRRDYFDFCIQKQNKGKYQVTTVCGEEEIHPGVFIKMIADHGISYSVKDCLIQCLNEALNMRHNPKEIRKKSGQTQNYQT